jgi:hypothetical protein
MSCTQGFANAEGFDPDNFVFIIFPFTSRQSQKMTLWSISESVRKRSARQRLAQRMRGVAAFGPLN